MDWCLPPSCGPVAQIIGAPDHVFSEQHATRSRICPAPPSVLLAEICARGVGRRNQREVMLSDVYAYTVGRANKA
jgi:hypothetical protein